MAYALQTTALVRRFGRHLAVDRLDMSVPKGAIYGFLGANGAGKTTTLRLVLGLLRQDGGRIELFGRRVGGDMPRIGALIETPSLYPHLTGRENLDLTRRLLRLPVSEIERVLRLVELTDASGQRVGGYSLGMRQRLAIARALLGKPRLLILDEPTNGLDPQGIHDMRGLIRRLSTQDGVTLIVSSHHLAEVEQVATHVGLIHRGRMLVEDSLPRLLGRASSVRVRTDHLPTTAGILSRVGFMARTDERGDLLVSKGDGAAPPPEFLAALIVESGQSLAHLSLEQPSLEQVYHHAIAA